MLDFVGTIVITTVLVVNVNALISMLLTGRAQKLTLALLVGLWVGLSVALASSGQLADANVGPIPLIGVMVFFPLIATALAAILIPNVRETLLGLPMPILIGLNFSRVFGALFLLLEGAGRLGGPFPFFAGWGDVITGMLAVPAAWLAATALRNHSRSIAIWNLFGALDLVLAVTLGVTSSNGSALQLIHVGAGSTAMQTLPWSLVPTVLVPFYLIVHGVLFAQLRARAGGAVKSSEQARVETA